jgi:hypothetical protein
MNSILGAWCVPTILPIHVHVWYGMVPYHTLKQNLIFGWALISPDNELHFRVKFALITCYLKGTPQIPVNFPVVRRTEIHLTQTWQKIERWVCVRVTVRMGLILFGIVINAMFPRTDGRKNRQIASFLKRRNYLMCGTLFSQQKNQRMSE